MQPAVDLHRNVARAIAHLILCPVVQGRKLGQDACGGVIDAQGGQAAGLDLQTAGGRPGAHDAGVQGT